MSFNVSGNTPRQRNFFVHQGSMVLSNLPGSLTNLDERYSNQSSLEQAHRRVAQRKPTSLTSLPDNDQSLRSFRKNMQPNYDNSLAPLNSQRNGNQQEFYLPVNYTPKMNMQTHSMVLNEVSPKNSLIPQKPVFAKSNSMTLPPIRLNVSPIGYVFPTPIENSGVFQRREGPSKTNIFSGMQGIQFQKKLDQQHQILDQLMMKINLSKSADFDNENEGSLSNKLKAKINKTNVKETLQKMQKSPTNQIDERTVSEENESLSPELPLTTGRKQARRTTKRKFSRKNFVPEEEEYSVERSIEKSPEMTRVKERKRTGVLQSLNDVGNNGETKFRRKKTIRSKSRVIIKVPVDKKQLARDNLKKACWALAYPSLLAKSVKEKALAEREETLPKAKQTMLSLHEILRKYILQIAGKQIKELFTDKSLESIFVSNKIIPDKKLNKECNALINSYKVILDKLYSNSKSIPTEFFSLLQTLIQEGSQLPHDYFTDFELKRQQFTYFGKLKFITAPKTRLIIGGIILRVLLEEIIMKPWESLQLNPKDFPIEKLLNIGSFLYVLFMGVLKGLVPIFHNNQSFLPLELKVRAKRKLSEALDLRGTEVKFNVDSSAPKDTEIMTGFYSKNQLQCFFEERKKSIDELKALIEGWLECLQLLANTQ